MKKFLTVLLALSVVFTAADVKQQEELISNRGS